MEPGQVCPLFELPRSDQTPGLTVQLHYKYNAREEDGVPYISLPGAIVCSANINLVLHDSTRSWGGSSLGTVIREMSRFGVYLGEEVYQKMREESQERMTKPVLFNLWERGENTPAAIQCSGIWVVGLPKSWNEHAAQYDYQEKDLRDLQQIYQLIRDEAWNMTRRYANPTGAIIMPGIGKSKRFQLRYAIHEIVALAVHCQKSAVPVKSLRILTKRPQSRDEYLELFRSEEWQNALHPEQHIGTLMAQLQAMLSESRERLPSPRFTEQLEEVASMWEAWKSCNEEWQHDPAKKALVQPLLRMMVFTCCSKARLAVEYLADHYLKQRPQACLRYLRSEPWEWEATRQPTLHDKLWALHKIAAVDDGLLRDRYTTRANDCCTVLKNTGNKAVHSSNMGNLTLVDAYVAMYSLVKLVGELVRKIDRRR
jgi:hypothetical protein